MTATSKRSWTYRLLLLLACEKIVQHAVVTTAFLIDWHAIRSTVVIDYRWLVILGALIGVLFVVATIGLLHDRRWSLDLLMVLALADIIGEFVAQGGLQITVTVSLIVAFVILLLAQSQYRQA